VDAEEAEALAARMAANLGGSYACVKDGKAVRPPVQPEVRLVETSAVTVEKTLQLAADFFGE
jgi:hypothetical protein